MVEAGLVDILSRCHWNLRRSALNEDAILAKQARDAPYLYPAEQARRADILGHILIRLPDCRRKENGWTWEDECEYRKWCDIGTSDILQELQNSQAGCDWLTKRWNHLLFILYNDGFWDHARVCEAGRMLGDDIPEDTNKDLTTKRLYEAFAEIMRYRKEEFEYLDKVEYYREHRKMEHPSPWSMEKWEQHEAKKAAARDELKSLVMPVLERLEGRRKYHTVARAEQDEKEAALRALIEVGPSGTHRMRYEGGCRREYRLASAELRKVRESAYLFEHGDTKVNVGVAEALSQPAPWSSSEVSKNEKEPEVTSGAPSAKAVAARSRRNKANPGTSEAKTGPKGGENGRKSARSGVKGGRSARS
jgi:hypothetical protein